MAKVAQLLSLVSTAAQLAAGRRAERRCREQAPQRDIERKLLKSSESATRGF